MKKIILLLSAVCMAFNMHAQQFVSTQAGSQHVLLEEFTGVKCGNCPAGHTEATTIRNASPGLVHVIAWPPTNSSYTDPAGTAGTDFRRSFADAFYTTPYCGSSRFMPSAFVDRVPGSNGQLIQSRGDWAGLVTAALSKTAPLNLAAKTAYDAQTKILTVDIEAYYLSNVTTNNAIYVVLVEDELTSGYQSGSSATAANPYEYKHTFRESISAGQWGDAVTGTTNQGDLFTKQYSIDLNNATDPVVIDNAHVIAFMIDATSAEKTVLNSIEVAANGATATTGAFPASVAEVNNMKNVRIYPNPSAGDIHVDFDKSYKSVTYKVLDIVGNTIASETSSNAITLERSLFHSAGIYVIQLESEGASWTQRIVVE